MARYSGVTLIALLKINGLKFFKGRLEDEAGFCNRT